jgi:hypothetical protein
VWWFRSSRHECGYSVEKCLTKTTLESFRCDGLFESNIHNRVRQGEPSNSGQWLAAEFESRCVTILPPQRRDFYVPEHADQTPSASGSPAADIGNDRIAAL